MAHVSIFWASCLINDTRSSQHSKWRYLFALPMVCGLYFPWLVWRPAGTWFRRTPMQRSCSFLYSSCGSDADWTIVQKEITYILAHLILARFDERLLLCSKKKRSCTVYLYIAPFYLHFSTSTTSARATSPLFLQFYFFIYINSDFLLPELDSQRLLSATRFTRALYFGVRWLRLLLRAGSPPKACCL